MKKPTIKEQIKVMKLLTDDVNVEKRTHHIWDELQELKKKLGKTSLMVIGKYHYIYSNSKGVVSLIELPNYFRDGVDSWEIYCLKGDLFEDIERFLTKEQAEKRIYHLLN